MLILQEKIRKMERVVIHMYGPCTQQQKKKEKKNSSFGLWQ